MKFLNTKKEITDWLDKYGIENYTLIPDPVYGFVVDVDDTVNLYAKKLKNIPVKFNVVQGDFYCNNNELISLEFCPSTVVGNFNCVSNKLTSLKFCPTSVAGDFYCSSNELTSLEFSPTTANGIFDCSNNKLTSLKFCPSNVGSHFYCHYNQLTSLQFYPSTVVGNFMCSYNKLKSLEFLPSNVGSFSCHNNEELGDTQHVHNSEELYEMHLKNASTAQKEALENFLVTTNKSKKIFKV